MYHHPYETLALAEALYRERTLERDRASAVRMPAGLRRTIAAALMDLGTALVATSRRVAREA